VARGNYPDFHPNLPGSIFELKDGMKNIQSRDLSGKKIVLIGTATDGPLLEPLNVSSYNDAKNIFGNYYTRNGQLNGTSLMKGLRRVLDAGADNVDLLRISGDYAHNEISLYEYEKSVERHSREYVGEMLGNLEATFDLSIPAGTYIENIEIHANGFLVSVNDYRVDTTNGIITIYEDSIDQQADVTVTYDLVKVTIVTVDEEVVTCTSPLSGREFQLENIPVEENSETVYYVDAGGNINPLTKNASSQGYTINYKTGIISTTNQVDISNGEMIVATYDYQQLDVEQKQYNDIAPGGVSYIEIDHQPDPTKPLIVLADGEEIDKEGFDVNYTYGYVNLKPGFIRKEQRIEILYYWLDEEVVKPKIEVRGIYPGSVYNRVKIHIEDIIEETPHIFLEEYDNANGLFLEASTNVDTDYTFFFPEGKRNLLKDSTVELAVFDGSGNLVRALTSGEFTVDYEYGIVTLDSSVYSSDIDTAGNYLKVTSFKYTIMRETKTPIVFGENLEMVNSRKARFHNDYIVPKPINLIVEDASGNLTNYAGNANIDYSGGYIDLSQPIGDDEKLIVEEYSYYNVVGKKIKIEKPEEKYFNGKTPLEFEVGSNIQTVGELVNAIRSHPRNNIIEASASEEILTLQAMNIKTPDFKLNPDGSVNKKLIALEFGSDGLDLTKDEVYDKLGGVKNSDGDKIEFGAYDVLMEHEDADIILPLEIYADDELAANYKNFAQQLANFCAKSFYRSNEVVGIIGLKPLKNPSRLRVISRVKRLQDMNLNFFLQDENFNNIVDDEGNMVDVGKYIRIIGHDLLYTDTTLQVPVIENGAAAFAAVKSMLAGDNSPTNEIIPKGRLAYRYSPTQMNSLSGARIVSFKLSGNNVKITDGITCAIPNSGWTRDLTVSIVFDAMEEVREVYDKYVGKGNTPERQGSLDSDIRDTLNKMETIVDFDYKIIMSPTDRVIGRMIVELDLVPVGELQRIKTVVSINSQLN
jgi:hypothetical protein